MLRKTLTILSLIGLLLSVGAWGVSYWGYFYGVFLDDYEVLVWAGDCRFRHKPPPLSGWMPQVMADAESTVYFQAIQSPTLVEEHVKKIGSFGSWTITGGRVFRCGTSHSVPLWIPSVAFFVLGISCVVPPAYRRRKRKKLGLCVKCGYDLRASKDRCPECGQEFETTCSARP